MDGVHERLGPGVGCAPSDEPARPRLDIINERARRVDAAPHHHVDDLGAAVASHRARGEGSKDAPNRETLGLREPGPRVETAHAVDEDQRVGNRCRRRRAQGTPVAGRDFDVDDDDRFRLGRLIR